MTVMLFVISMILTGAGFFAVGFLWGHGHGCQMYREFAIRVCNIYNDETAKTIGNAFVETKL